MRSVYKFKCKVCENAMVKAGKNDTGKQRYNCNICNTRTVIKKDNISRQNELKMFVNWLIDSTKVEHRINTSRSTFYRKTKWCWGVVPKIKLDGIPSVFIFVDATYLSRNLCLLVARNDKVVLNYRWAKQEDFENYYELLKPLERPGFVICDGHRGIAKACAMLWKNIDVQRCVVHIARSAERKLGKRSPSEVNHIFRKHIKKLPALHTRKKSENWCKKFCSLYETHKDHIEHISYSIDSETGEIIRKYRTHQKLFSVCREINILLSKNRLFLFIEHNIPNNSNCIAYTTGALAAGMAALGAATVAAGAYLYGMAKQTAYAGNAVDEYSRRMGFFRQAIQEWDYTR